MATRTWYADSSNQSSALTETYSYTYGRLTGVERFTGRTETYTPVLIGQVLSGSSSLTASMVVEGIETRITFNMLGQPTQIVENYTSSAGVTRTQNVTTYYQYWQKGDWDYDLNDTIADTVAGLPKVVTLPDPDGSGGESPYEISLWYDQESGMPIKAEHSDGTTELWSYSGDTSFVTSYTDRLGHTTTYGYDGDHNLTSLQRGDATWEWEYDPAGSDILGLPSAAIDPLDVRTEYTYTAAKE